MARPPKKDKDGNQVYHIPTMCKKIKQYIKENEDGIPILKECCLQNDWSYDHVMGLQRENAALSQSIKKLLQQKEVNLEKGMLSGQLNTTGAIFVLKQPAHGWKDKHDEDTQKDVMKKLDEVLEKIT